MGGERPLMDICWLERVSGALALMEGELRFVHGGDTADQAWPVAQLTVVTPKPKAKSLEVRHGDRTLTFAFYRPPKAAPPEPGDDAPGAADAAGAGLGWLLHGPVRKAARQKVIRWRDALLAGGATASE